MDTTTAHMLPECYRGSSPRSASTPGPAPDSPASASGRFSASPLLSPCFPYYPHLHGTGTLGLMGLGAASAFFTSTLTPYALGLSGALSAHAGVSMLPVLSSPPASGMMQLNQQRIAMRQPPTLAVAPAGVPNSAAVSPVVAAAAATAVRPLPFSVENILKPEFGQNTPVTAPPPLHRPAKSVQQVSANAINYNYNLVFNSIH